MNLTRENYYDVGSKEDLILSNSALSAINPHQGGSFKKFERFYDEETEKKSSLSLERGKLFHMWMEHGTELFHEMVVDKPSEKMGQIAEALVEAGKEWGYTLFADFNEDQLLEFANTIGYGQTWKPETVSKKVIESCATFVDEVLHNTDKIGITTANRELLSKCYLSIEENEDIQKLLQRQVGNEACIYCESEVALTGVIADYTFKVLIDRLAVYKTNFGQEIHIIDFKTTSKPVSTFLGTWQPAMNEQGDVMYIPSAGAFFRYRTYRQMAIYREVVEQWAKENFEGNTVVKCYIPVVETVDMFESRLVPVSESILKAGIQETYDIISEVNRYKKWRDAQEA